MSTSDPIERATTAGLNPVKRLFLWLIHNFWALSIIVVVAVASLIVVKVFKKPGQMSVIESQSMDMSSMTPPSGAVPVGIATVQVGDIEGSVTYTGTVQSFDDEDIYPRLTGRIVRMPVYPGDRVRKGQLLAQLDPADRSEYAARLEEARYAASAAMHNAGIARDEFKEKQYEFNAARDAEKEAQQALSEAQAKLDYWIPEIKRQDTLLKGKVISQAEYDSELSEYKTAQARVAQAKDKASQSKNITLAAQAAFDGAVHHVGHVFDESKKMEAAQQGAAIVESYTRITAADDGVVTKRLISPGVLVNPQMQILKVAHIKRVRLQAEVASEDLARIRLGAPVYVEVESASSRELQAKVTAIFPAADPSSRTSIVEAMIDNMHEPKEEAGQKEEHSPGHAATRDTTDSDYHFLPGQYVVMRMSTGIAREALTIPTAGLIFSEGHTQVWKAAGSSSGVKQSVLCQVETGLSNPEKTEITAGLAASDQIIYAGYAGLKPHTPVIGVEWGDSGPKSLPTAAEAAVNRLDQSNQWTISSLADHTRIHISMSSSPPKPDANSLIVKLEHHGGGPITGARITGQTSMPGMDMKGPDLRGREVTPGTYQLASNFMSGLWEVDLTVVTGAGQKQMMTVELEVPE